MNDSRLERLLEEFQDDKLSEDECRELLEWCDEDESRLTAIADELRMGNMIAALHRLDSDGIAPVVIDSLSRAGLTSDIPQQVRRHIENSDQHSTSFDGESMTTTSSP